MLPCICARTQSPLAPCRYGPDDAHPPAGVFALLIRGELGPEELWKIDLLHIDTLEGDLNIDPLNIDTLKIDNYLIYDNVIFQGSNRYTGKCFFSKFPQ